MTFGSSRRIGPYAVALIGQGDMSGLLTGPRRFCWNL